MARTASTGFFYRKSLYGIQQPVTFRFRLANTTTFKIGDAVRINSSGFLTTADTSTAVLGVLAGIVNDQSVNPFALGVATDGATLIPGDSLTTSSTNQTRADYMQGEVILDPAGALFFYNKASGNLAATDVGNFYNLTTASQVNQGSKSGTSGQFQLVATDPDNDGDATKGLFRVAIQQLITQAGNATAILNA